MNLIADLHIHSHLSRACSKLLHPEILYKWSQLKGINVLSTGDFTHPQWMEEIKEKCEPAELGLFRLKEVLAKKMDPEIPESCKDTMRFLLGVEISSIYKKNDRLRRVHNLVFMPSFKAADKFNATLDKIGNIKSDGRPILGLDSKKLLQLVRDTDPEAYLIPAHAWTPHFAVFGSESGFDSLEECFEELASEIFAIETGLSSDPPMNWRIKELDRLMLVSNSDAHSPEKLGREANVYDTDLSYKGIFDPLKDHDLDRFKGTIEFFPQEGKYHEDGHRKCQVRMKPAETIAKNKICRECNKPVTVGVLHRIEKLATRKDRITPPRAAPFENIIPLKEIIGQLFGVGPSSKKVDKEYHNLLQTFGNEFYILRSLPLEQLEAKGALALATALEKMRKGQVRVQAGYDGEYGIISVVNQDEKSPKKQLSLL